MSEIILLGILALIVIGPKELPELARTLGRFLNELKRTTNVLGDELKSQTGLDRINLSESLTSKPSKIAVEQETSETPPEQMELTEQSNAHLNSGDSSTDEQKKS